MISESTKALAKIALKEIHSLEEIIKIARREERERCAKLCEDDLDVYVNYMADKIRALEDEK